MATKYLYGIIRNTGPGSFGPIGLPGGLEEVYLIVQGSMAAVVSDHLGPQPAELPRQELLRQLALHQKVIETVMREHSVLPARFGTLLPGGRDVRRAMHCGSCQLAPALERLDGLVQYEVAATWQLGPVLDEISSEGEIAALRDAAAGMPPADSLGLRVKIGQMVKASLDRRREELESQLTSLLAEHAVDRQANALMGDEMVMNVAFLVDRSARERFLSGLHRVDSRFDGKLNLRCIGPLPPYSFGMVEIVRPDPGEVDAALELLGLEARISLSAVRRAYREQAARLHPDVNPSLDAKDGFARLRRAEALLVGYCQGKVKGNGSRENRICHATPDEVERSYLVTVKRTGD